MTRGRHKQKREKREAQEAAKAQNMEPIIKMAVARTRSSRSNTIKWFWPAWGRSTLVFALGVVVTLFLQQWFVGLLPGPQVSAHVRGLQITSGNAAGCTVYQIDFSNDYAIEYASGRSNFQTE